MRKHVFSGKTDGTGRVRRAQRLVRQLLSVLLASALLCGCTGPVNQTVEGAVSIYYLNEDENTLIYGNYVPQLSTVKDQVEELRGELLSDPADGERIRLLPDGMTMEIADLTDRTLSLRFPESYYDMEKTREVLMRAGIVRTFVQIEGVDRVQFFIGDEPLADAAGHPIGPMRKETFVDNSAQQLNNYEKASVKLYFANEDGDALVEESRTIYHISSQPLEWAVVARLIAGPAKDGCFAALPADTEIISVSTSNDVCYVNLSSSFLNNSLNVQEEIPIYSIVNSITESCGVPQVQIAVEGDIKVTYGENMRLDVLYEENKGLVK